MSHLKPHILFAGGGSLGNIYPGIAVAQRLLQMLPGARITFAGDGRPIERHTVRASGYGYQAIPGKQTPQRWFESFRFVTDNTLGYCAMRWMLQEQEISLVVGLGGHASATALRAAKSLGRPIILLEPNVSPSFSTRWMADKAEAVCLAFEETLPHLPVTTSAMMTGIPGRPTLERKSSIKSKKENPKRLVILGGEGGASSLNESMPVALSRTSLAREGWSVVHQTGEGQLLETMERYRRAEVDALVVTYIDELADLLKVTDLVICRSSGCTISELSRAGVASVLVPDSRSYQDWQSENARLAERYDMCQVLDDDRPDFIERLAEKVTTLAENEEHRNHLAKAASRAFRPEAASRIAEVCADALGYAPAEKAIRRLAA